MKHSPVGPTQSQIPMAAPLEPWALGEPHWHRHRGWHPQRATSLRTACPAGYRRHKMTCPCAENKIPVRVQKSRHSCQRQPPRVLQRAPRTPMEKPVVRWGGAEQGNPFAETVPTKTDTCSGLAAQLGRKALLGAGAHCCTQS